MIERAPRKKKRISCEIISSNSRYTGIVIDISATGLFVQTNVKPAPGWGWMTLNGAVTVMLAWMILKGWPESALWAVGILVGVRLLFAGITMLTLGSAAGQVSKATDA